MYALAPRLVHLTNLNGTRSLGLVLDDWTARRLRVEEKEPERDSNMVSDDDMSGDDDEYDDEYDDEDDEYGDESDESDEDEKIGKVAQAATPDVAKKRALVESDDDEFQRGARQPASAGKSNEVTKTPPSDKALEEHVAAAPDVAKKRTRGDSDDEECLTSVSTVVASEAKRQALGVMHKMLASVRHMISLDVDPLEALIRAEKAADAMLGP